MLSLSCLLAQQVSQLPCLVESLFLYAVLCISFIRSNSCGAGQQLEPHCSYGTPVLQFHPAHTSVADKGATVL